MHEPPWPSSAAIVPLRAEPLNSSPPLPTDSTAALLAAAAAVAVGSCGAGVFVGRGARVALAPLVGVGGAGVTVGGDAWPNPPVANAAAAPSTSTTGTPISAQRHLLRGVVSS